MASPADVAAPGIGTVIQAGFAVADWLNRGRGISREQRAQLDAARDAGYVRRREGWYSPDGARLLEREVSGEGQWVQSSLLQAGVALMDFQASRYTFAGEVGELLGRKRSRDRRRGSSAPNRQDRNPWCGGTASRGDRELRRNGRRGLSRLRSVPGQPGL
jgi:hypothetical protein